MTEPDIIRTWLRWDDCTCGRCHKWAGPEGTTVYVVAAEHGLVCTECITPAEEARAVARETMIAEPQY